MKKLLKFTSLISMFFLSYLYFIQSAFADVISPGQTGSGCSVSGRRLHPVYCGIAEQGLLPYVIAGIIILVIIVSIIVLIRIRKKNNSIPVIK